MKLEEGNFILFLLEYKIITDEKQSTFCDDFYDFGEYLSSLVFIIMVCICKFSITSEEEAKAHEEQVNFLPITDE